MATKKGHRIGIWIIAFALVVGTLGSFLAMMIEPQNAANDQARMEEQLAAYQKEQQAAAEERAKTTEPLKGYKAEPFDANDVKELKKEVLVQGKGEEVKVTDTVSVSYFGWLSSGKIFDSSTISGKDTPIELPLDGVITGWTEGLTGAKVGSTIKLTIPADMAYGEQASGIIPANSPLTFILTIHSIVNDTEEVAE